MQKKIKTEGGSMYRLEAKKRNLRNQEPEASVASEGVLNSEDFSS